MSKIKLLTLLLISFFFVSCSSTNYQIKNNYKYSLDYIGGGYDGLVLKKQLISKLRGFNSYDPNSRKSIQSEIDHSTEVFVTNIDNTSEREEVISSLKIRVFDTKLNCVIFRFEDQVSQFYIYASSEKFLSNTKALETIKYNNTEELVKSFISSLTKVKFGCLK